MDQELRWWWAERFGRPFSLDDEERYTPFELERLYWQEHFLKHPAEARRNERGEIETGDAVLDGFERKIASGQDPTEDELRAGMSSEQLRRLDLERELFVRTGVSAPHAIGAVTVRQLEDLVGQARAKNDRVTPPAPKASAAAPVLGARGGAPRRDRPVRRADLPKTQDAPVREAAAAFDAPAQPPGAEVRAAWAESIARARERQAARATGTDEEVAP